MFPIPEKMPNFHHYSMKNIPTEHIYPSRRLVDTVQQLLESTGHRLRSTLTTSTNPENISLAGIMEIGTLTGRFVPHAKTGELTIVQSELPFSPHQFLQAISEHFATISVFYSPLVRRRSGVMVPDFSQIF